MNYLLTNASSVYPFMEIKKDFIWCIFQLKIQECGNKVVGAGVWGRRALVREEENEDEGP